MVNVASCVSSNLRALFRTGTFSQLDFWPSVSLTQGPLAGCCSFLMRKSSAAGSILMKFCSTADSCRMACFFLMKVCSTIYFLMKFC